MNVCLCVPEHKGAQKSPRESISCVFSCHCLPTPDGKNFFIGPGHKTPLPRHLPAALTDTSCPVSQSHTRARLSSLAVTAQLPPASTATRLMRAAWPDSTCSRRPLSASQMRAVPSWR